jgi:hypothetical protein
MSELDTLAFKLSLAAKNGDKAGVKNWIKQGVDINEKAVYGRTTLHSSTLIGTIGTMRLLLDHGTNVNDDDENGDTILHIAVNRDSAKRIALLLNHGADPHAKNGKGQTPLMWLVHAIRAKINPKDQSYIDLHRKLKKSSAESIKESLKSSPFAWILRFLII